MSKSEAETIFQGTSVCSHKASKFASTNSAGCRAIGKIQRNYYFNKNIITVSCPKGSAQSNRSESHCDTMEIF